MNESIASPPDDVIASLELSKIRAGFAIVALVGLAFLLAFIAFRLMSINIVMFLVMGCAVMGALILALKLYHALQKKLLLRASGIYDQSGNLLLLIEDISAINRGTFAIKPTQGFVIYARKVAKPAWHPGLWWRYGRRIGIGGSTGRAETGFFAEQLQMLKTNSQTSGI